MKLPADYISKMKNLLGDEYDAYLASLSEPMNHSLRVNTLKISVEEFLEISPFNLEKVPWSENAFYYDESECSPSKHPYYYAGLYYLQEPSAVLPAATLPINEGDKVLDICSAPGGKSTELAAKLKGTGILVSNDISASRLKALQKNIEVFGAQNVIITCETPEKLGEFFTAYFDKILIDAPCSGEGMFRKSNSMISAWEINGNQKFADIQKSILKEVVKMLKPGGEILYSTCTFDPIEDEDQVQYLLNLRRDLKLQPIEKHEGFVPGNQKWCSLENASSDLSNTVHLFPHKVKGEGHFVALFKSDGSKPDENYNEYSDVTMYQPRKYREIPEIEEFLDHIKGIDRSRLEFNKDKLFLVPKDSPDVKGLRVMRQGVYLGELKKKRFEPSQSFAMILDSENFDNVLKLKADSGAVIKYLRGETIDIDEVMDNQESEGDRKITDGWALVCVDRFPLGFGKCKNGVMKNKYLPGWRLTGNI